MFFPGSRYADAGSYEVTTADNRTVTVTRIPLPQSRDLIGWHRRLEGERLDLLAYRYLGDATAFWQLCEAANAIVPDALETRPLIPVPRTG